jgi:hypothetical protein
MTVVAPGAPALSSSAARVQAPLSPCERGCDQRGCWLLVFRYTVNLSEVNQRPVWRTQERFDGQRFPTEAAAFCGARLARLHGVELPTLERFGRDSNVVPESITPMPHLLALELGIAGPE